MARQDSTLAIQKFYDNAISIEQLLEEYRPLIYKEIWRYIRHVDDVEDLVQDVYVRVLERIEDLREVKQFSTWLRRIAANIALDWLRSNRVRNYVPHDEIEPFSEADVITPESSYDERDRVIRLTQYMRLLSSTERRALKLRYQEGCSYDQVARAMGLKLGTMRWHMRRGKQRLKELWEHEDAFRCQRQRPFGHQR